MAMTAEEADELHATIGEALAPLWAADLGNITHADACARVREVLNRMDAAAVRARERARRRGAVGCPDPAQARLETMAEAVRVLCHDLRDGATVLLATAELVRRYAARGKRDADPGMFDRADAKAALLMDLVRERVAAIEAGEARALGVGQGGDPGGEG